MSKHQPFLVIDLTGVRSLKPCYACYDLRAQRIVCYGGDRQEMFAVTDLLNHDPVQRPASANGGAQ